MRIRSRQTTNHFLVEARLATDQYERSDGPNDGIPKEGVLVYEVVSTFSVFLRAVLTVGGQFDNAAEGLRIRVTQAIQGGFSITVQSSASSECPKICENLADLEKLMEGESDPFRARQLRQEILRQEDRAERLGCSCKSSGLVERSRSQT